MKRANFPIETFPNKKIMYKYFCKSLFDIFPSICWLIYYVLSNFPNQFCINWNSDLVIINELQRNDFNLFSVTQSAIIYLVSCNIYGRDNTGLYSKHYIFDLYRNISMCSQSSSEVRLTWAGAWYGGGGGDRRLQLWQPDEKLSSKIQKEFLDFKGNV